MRDPPYSIGALKPEPRPGQIHSFCRLRASWHIVAPPSLVGRLRGPWAILKLFGAVLDPSWAVLEACWGYLGFGPSCPRHTGRPPRGWPTPSRIMCRWGSATREGVGPLEGGRPPSTHYVGFCRSTLVQGLHIMSLSVEPGRFGSTDCRRFCRTTSVWVLQIAFESVEGGWAICRFHSLPHALAWAVGVL